jgi:predicted MFS family arabinose efflux permease
MRNTMADDLHTEQMRSPGRLVLPALAISDFAMVLPSVLTSLLLIDIGLTFGYSVGVIGQILAIASSVGIVTTLIVGALSIRFKHSWLLIAGLAFFCVSALACGFSSSTLTWFVGSSLGALGSSMVTPMLLTAVGDYFPHEKRPGAIGLINTSGALAYIIGQPAIGFIASLSGWRLAYLGFLLPIALLGLFLSFVGLPAEPHTTQPTSSSTSYLEGFSQIVRNKSAFACLIGVVFWNAGFVSILTYSTSFYREQFAVSMPLMSILNIGRMLSYIFASLVCSRLLKRYERKSVTVATGLLAGLSTIIFFLIPDLWI